MNRIVFILCVILFSYDTQGQLIKVGELCPDVTLKNVLNYPRTELSIKDFKGRNVVLDFWGTGCAACIAAFPKLDSLQKVFGDQLQIVLVNDESKDSVFKFFNKRKNIRVPVLPMIMGDSILNQFFPHNFLPWQVWIDKEGVVRYITNGWNANHENLAGFIAGKKLAITQLQYIKNDENVRNSLISSAGGKEPLYYSYIMNCVQGMLVGNFTIGAPGKKEPYRISRNCYDILKLIIEAYNEGEKYDFNYSAAVVLNVKDNEKYFFPKDIKGRNKWFAENSYSYELNVPPDKAGQTYQMMQDDLKRFFALDIKIEKRKIRCYVLSRTDSIDRLKSARGKPSHNLYKESSDSNYFLTNTPFEKFVSRLRSRFVDKKSPIPFIDATGYSGKADMVLAKAAVINIDIPELNSELKKYGLVIKEQDHITDVLIIKDEN
jgi:uncharacterized protein (TIGR03435 family)